MTKTDVSLYLDNLLNSFTNEFNEYEKKEYFLAIKILLSIIFENKIDIDDIYKFVLILLNNLFDKSNRKKEFEKELVFCKEILILVGLLTEHYHSEKSRHPGF